MFNILYDGRVIYKNLSHDECAEIINEMTHSYYEENQTNIDPYKIELEEI